MRSGRMPPDPADCCACRTPGPRRGVPVRCPGEQRLARQIGAEYRGFVQYYLLAFNAHRLRRVHRVMRISLRGTLANKHKTRIAPIYRRLRTEVRDRGRCQTALTVTRERSE